MRRLDFAELRDDGRFSDFTKLRAKQIEKLHRSFRGIPADYIQFVSTIGFGALGGSRAYAFYGGLVSPTEVYDPITARSIANVVLFGDDFAGNNNGFDPTRKWCVVRIDQAGERSRATRVATTFTSFLEKLLR